jgi:colicin import membrane protein
MTTPTIKDTKATIFEAYKTVVAKLKEKNVKAMNVEDIKVNKVNKEVVEKAIHSAMDVKGLTSLAGSLQTFSDDMITKMGEYVNIQSAIELKESELKELFDIEKEAFTLAALVDSHDAIKDNFNAEMNLKKSDLKEQLDAITDGIVDLKRVSSVERKRDVEQYEYDFARDKKEKMNVLKDELTKLSKDHLDNVMNKNDELSRWKLELTEREQLIKDSEEETEELRKTVDEIPELIIEAIKSKVGKAEGMLKSKFDTEKGFMVAAQETKDQVNATKISEMGTTIEALNISVLSLQTKLDAAYGEIKAMAIATVEGAGNSKAINEITAALSKKNA